MPEVPSGHVDKIEATVVSNQSTQVNDVEQGKTNWMYDTLPPDRVAEVKGKYEGTQYRIGARDRPRLHLDEHDPAAVRRPQGPPGGQLRDQPEAARTDLRRRSHADPADHPAGRARLQEARPLPATTWRKPRRCSRKPTPPTSTSRSGPTASTTKRANTSNRLLDEIGFNAKLKVVNSENYFTVIGNEKTPNLDLGFAGFGADYPDPNAFFEPLLSGASILPTNNTNLSRIDDPTLNKKIEQLAAEPLGPKQEKEYAALDKEYMEQAPLGALRQPDLVAVRLQRHRLRQRDLEPDLLR